MNTTSVIKLMPETKEQIQNFAEQVVNEVLNGGLIDPLELDLRLKSIEETVKLIRKNESLKSFTFEEAEKYSGKTFEFKGCKITKGARRTFNYDNCNDYVLIGLKESQDQLKEQIKIRETILKSGIDAATGESLIKPTEKISEFLTIKLK